MAGEGRHPRISWLATTKSWMVQAGHPVMRRRWSVRYLVLVQPIAKCWILYPYTRSLIRDAPRRSHPTAVFAARRACFFAWCMATRHPRYSAQSRAHVAELFGVERGNEIRQRLLPSLLMVVVQAAELLRIHAEFARHLHVCMRQVVFPSRLDPRLQLWYISPRFCHEPRLHFVRVRPCPKHRACQSAPAPAVRRRLISAAIRPRHGRLGVIPGVPPRRGFGSAGQPFWYKLH